MNWKIKEKKYMQLKKKEKGYYHKTAIRVKEESSSMFRIGSFSSCWPSYP